MPTRMVSLRQSPTYIQNAAGVYGNQRAARFFQDLVAGRDSLDVVTIGDSNMGNNSYGYTVGLNRVLNYSYGIPYYATPLFPGSLGSGPTNQLGNLFQPNVRLRWCGDNQVGSSGTVRTLAQAAAGGDTQAGNLKTALGFDSTNLGTVTGAEPTTRLPVLLWGVEWMGAYVAAGTTYTSAANNNLIELGSAHPLNYGSGSGGVGLSYRVVYGTFSGGSGQFKLRASNNSTLANLNTTAAYKTTNTGTAGYAVESLSFNSPSTTPTTLICGWDGFNSGNSATGPFACLWHSITAQAGKGVCVNNLLYHGGRSTTLLADRVEYMDKLLNSYLQELRERQQAAGGSGRVLIFVNMGINANSNDNGTAYTAAGDRMIARISARWAATGGVAANLAFVFTVTHATTASGSEPTWSTNRVGVNTGVNAWATGKAGDAAGVCVVDLSQNYPAIRLSTEGLYDSGGQAHLNSTTTTQANGYDAVAGSIVSSLLASV